jgi:hypothetical protein
VNDSIHSCDKAAALHFSITACDRAILSESDRRYVAYAYTESDDLFPVAVHQVTACSRYCACKDRRFCVIWRWSCRPCCVHPLSRNRYRPKIHDPRLERRKACMTANNAARTIRVVFFLFAFVRRICASTDAGIVYGVVLGCGRIIPSLQQKACISGKQLCFRVPCTACKHLQTLAGETCQSLKTL